MATSDLATSGGFERGRYFSRAWSLLTREKGWWKPVAVCAAADLVPVAGPLGVLGYRLEWARLVAWGADVSEKGFTRSGIATVPDFENKVTAGSDQERWVGKS